MTYYVASPAAFENDYDQQTANITGEPGTWR